MPGLAPALEPQHCRRLTEGNRGKPGLSFFVTGRTGTLTADFGVSGCPAVVGDHPVDDAAEDARVVPEQVSGLAPTDPPRRQ
jgi:hypothetical protein